MRYLGIRYKNNKGISLLEIIAVIAIMATLTGLLVPRLNKYVADSRRDACVQNREAILSVYEKCVYGGNLTASQSSLDTLLAASDSSVLPQEYMNQVKEYLTCPSDDNTGHFTVTYAVSGGTAKAYITCDQHPDEVCMVDLTGWAMIGDPEAESADNVIANPASSGATFPFEPDASSSDTSDEEEPVAYDEDVFSAMGVWPYSLDSDGKTDIRWKSVGTAVGKYVSIPVPRYAHFEDNGQEYVIIRPNDTKGSGYKVMYEKSGSPSANVGDGCLYNITDATKKEIHISSNGQKDSSYNDNCPTSQDVLLDGEVDKYRVQVSASHGDILTVQFADGSRATYLYTGEARQDITLPTTADKAYGMAYDDWYIVPDKTN